MIFFDYIFYRIYRSNNIVNKSIPEWSAIIVMSLILMFNIISVLLYIDYDLKSLNANYLRYSLFVIIGMNYFFFLHKQRHLKIIKKYGHSNLGKNILHDILILLYACISVYFFFNLLKVELKYSVFVISIIIISSSLAWLWGKSIAKNNR